MGIKETMRKGFEKATKINEERKLLGPTNHTAHTRTLEYLVQVC